MKRANVRAISDLGYTYRIRADVTIMVLKHLEKEQIDEILLLSAKYNRAALSAGSGENERNNNLGTMRNVPITERTDGGLLVDNYTISQDNVMGQEARKAELLAQFGKKQFTLGSRTPNAQVEKELVENKPCDNVTRLASVSKFYKIVDF
ncbi:hypothetical protein ONS96_001543 [Cadophora gregata f. sp. sojae]|nr:hypothetical protein ONS96_001543 [Cadophora gregata f. sp. sojae]